MKRYDSSDDMTDAQWWIFAMSMFVLVCFLVWILNFVHTGQQVIDLWDVKDMAADIAPSQAFLSQSIRQIQP